MESTGPQRVADRTIEQGPATTGLDAIIQSQQVGEDLADITERGCEVPLAEPRIHMSRNATYEDLRAYELSKFRWVYQKRQF
jgi:hypothetical protein